MNWDSYHPPSFRLSTENNKGYQELRVNLIYMPTVDREPGGSTMIRVSMEIKDQLNALKVHPREAIDDCVERLIKENQTFHNIYPSTQTRPRMEKDMSDFVLNPAVPSTFNHHRQIYMESHPDEVLNNTDIIHHINGNHDDNRPENLMKTTDAEHRKLDAELTKKNALLERPMPRPLGCFAPEMP